MTTVAWDGLRDVASPDYPDPRVFGPPDGPEPGEQCGWPTQVCRACQVGWRGRGPCWCCGATLTAI